MLILHAFSRLPWKHMKDGTYCEFSPHGQL